MKKGKLFVFSGPSGVGKGTLVNRILKYKNLNLVLSISMTTRNKRFKEIHGEHYFFISKNEFIELTKQDKLLEYSNHFENYYGTPQEYVDATLNSGKNILLEIETTGAMQVMAKRQDAISIFLLPPNIKELEKRIRSRGTEMEEKIQTRLNRATLEMNYKTDYKYILINENIDSTEKKLVRIIKKEIKNEI